MHCLLPIVLSLAERFLLLESEPAPHLQLENRACSWQKSSVTSKAWLRRLSPELGLAIITKDFAGLGWRNLSKGFNKINFVHDGLPVGCSRRKLKGFRRADSALRETIFQVLTISGTLPRLYWQEATTLYDSPIKKFQFSSNQDIITWWIY